jgi:cell division septation protein DedD
MNRAMVKRGIGAAALAILAALLLGYLLKDKGQERQEVVNMKLPGASEVKDSLNIPALKGSDTAKNLTQKGEDEIVASADGAAEKVNEATKDLKVKEVAVNTFKNKGEDLDFTVRPPKGERREIVDNIGKSRQDTASTSGSSSRGTLRDDGDIAASASAGGGGSRSGSISRSAPSDGTVVASSDRGYRPRLVDEKRRSANYGLDNSSELTRRERRELREKHRAEKRRAERKAVKAKEDAEEEKKRNKADKDHYAIQLLATSSSSRANKLKSVMGDEGYPTRVSKTNGNGKVLFRVRIGNYTTRQGAVSAQRTMQRRYKRNQYVNDSIIVAR